MGCKIRHTLLPRRRDGEITVHVCFDDERYPESFRCTPAALRRFAWALLADLDPSEAELAREEELARHAEQFAFELTDLGKYEAERTRRG